MFLRVQPHGERWRGIGFQGGGDMAGTRIRRETHVLAYPAPLAPGTLAGYGFRPQDRQQQRPTGHQQSEQRVQKLRRGRGLGTTSNAVVARTPPSVLVIASVVTPDFAASGTAD